MKSQLASTLGWSAYTLFHARREHQVPWQDLATTLATQRRRTLQTVRHALANVPFYRDVIRAQGLRIEEFRGAEDLCRFPLIDASVYDEQPERFRSSLPLGNTLSIGSSGATGRSRQFAYDARAVYLAWAHDQRQRHIIAHRIGDKPAYRELILAKDGGASSLIDSYCRDHLWLPRGLESARQFLPPGSLNLDEEAARINAFRPDVVRGNGSHLGALYRSLVRRGFPFHHPSVIVYGGDAMAPSDRARIENELRIPVASSYESAEAPHIGYQCTSRHSFHLALDSVAVRLVDPDGKDVAPGVAGEVVISNLTNRATVLLNYRLGDLAVLNPMPCPCGRALPVLELLEGRIDEVIRLSDSRTLHASQLLPRLRTASDLNHIQVIQRDSSIFQLNAVAEGPIDRSATESRLASELAALTGTPNQLSVEWVNTLPPEPNGKTRLVISRLPA